MRTIETDEPEPQPKKGRRTQQNAADERQQRQGGRREEHRQIEAGRLDPRTLSGYSCQRNSLTLMPKVAAPHSKSPHKLPATASNTYRPTAQTNAADKAPPSA